MTYGSETLKTKDVTALIPIKARHLCKTRLSLCLTEQQRRTLVRDMLQQVLQVLQQVPAIMRIVVLTPERDHIAESIELLPDEGKDLNSSLTHAVVTLRQGGCGRLLILPADLPRLSVKDLNAILAADTLAIAASEDELGTNGLYLPNNLPFSFAFGDNSFQLHRQQAEHLQVPYRLVRSPGLAFDVDTPADYARYQSASAHTPTDADTICSAFLGADPI